LVLKPRVAVFDCDGTLWAVDAGEGFFEWEIQQGLLPPAVAEPARRRYRDYKQGKVDEDTMCGELVTLHRGLREAEIEQAARRFFAEQVAATIFPEMMQLARVLAQRGCQLWAVSSTNQWVVREGARRFGIEPARVLAVAAGIEGEMVTDRLLRVPTGEGKAAAVRELVGPRVDVAFGNTIFDLAMLELARQPFAVNPNPDLEEIARQRGWPIFWPGSSTQPSAPGPQPGEPRVARSE